MKKKGSELIFISRILRDGSGVEKIEYPERIDHIQETVFNLTCLSITKGTWIASEFNSYVVKLKK